MTKICIIGAGNISNTRHIPAIRKYKNLEITGIVSDDEKKIKRTQDKYTDIKNALLITGSTVEDVLDELKACPWFMNEVDAVVIGTPPKKHYLMTKVCLLLNKHVLVEKPMMMNPEECADVNACAREHNLILNVMHSFQFSNGMMELDRRYRSGEFGELQSILEIQLTNRDRRLPVWYNDLPLGLFYDEAAHFFYSADRFGTGELTVLNAHAQFGKDGGNTPKFLQVQMRAGDVPVQMMMNFNSPICEWGLLLLCRKKIAIYDYFKDILVVIDNDNEHYAKDVLKVSTQFFFRFWKGFIKNGFKMVSGKLLYGHDVAIGNFVRAIETGVSDSKMDGEIGMRVVKAMNEVASLVEKDT